jgi:hypothetical protein
MDSILLRTLELATPPAAFGFRFENQDTISCGNKAMFMVLRLQRYDSGGWPGPTSATSLLTAHHCTRFGMALGRRRSAPKTGWSYCSF